MIAADDNNDDLKVTQNNDVLAASSTSEVNEIFAKMVGKKLNFIKNPVRLARMHTAIMNVLQQAIADQYDDEHKD
ncbi:unnamed protein product [Anisakis simplex]|uniref:DUF3467 domain-containing protein n=1 Tax=Anisakis simplex TaxID=6269 RepID=A0A0M3J3A2_ANISI|nr:unnamed protein product [Anisakis simplex]